MDERNKAKEKFEKNDRNSPKYDKGTYTSGGGASMTAVQKSEFWACLFTFILGICLARWIFLQTEFTPQAELIGGIFLVIALTCLVYFFKPFIYIFVFCFGVVLWGGLVYAIFAVFDYFSEGDYGLMKYLFGGIAAIYGSIRFILSYHRERIEDLNFEKKWRGEQSAKELPPKPSLENIQREVNKILCKRLNIKEYQITPNTDLFKDLNLKPNDIRFMDIIVDIEKLFRIDEIPDMELADIDKVHDIYTSLARHAYGKKWEV